MKHISIISLSLLAAAALTGCSTLNNIKGVFTKPTAPVVAATGEVETETAQETELAINGVLYGEWTVARVGDQTVTGDERPYVIFDTTSVNPFILKVYANNGCNVLNGQMSVTPGGEMKPLGDFLSTMQFCPDAPYEMGINLAFNQAAKFNIEKIGQDYLLYMKDKSDNSLLILRKSDISFINGAWTVTKIDGQEVPDSAGIQMVIDVPEMKVHGNTGCNILNGSLFLDPDKQNSIQFVKLATTRMMCPDAEREQHFLVALEQVETVVAADKDDEAILKDAQGHAVITLKRLDLKNMNN